MVCLVFASVLASSISENHLAFIFWTLCSNISILDDDDQGETVDGYRKWHHRTKRLNITFQTATTATLRAVLGALLACFSCWPCVRSRRFPCLAILPTLPRLLLLCIVLSP